MLVFSSCCFCENIISSCHLDDFWIYFIIFLDYRCAGYPWNECNNAGDCMKGQCICDLGFSGNNCESNFLILMILWNWLIHISFKAVNQCYNDCNGYGPCDMDTGMCHCPGFKGIGCRKYQSDKPSFMFIPSFLHS